MKMCSTEKIAKILSFINRHVLSKMWPLPHWYRVYTLTWRYVVQRKLQKCCLLIFCK